MIKNREFLWQMKHFLLFSQALVCSCFVPLYCGVIPPTYKGVVSEKYMNHAKIMVSSSELWLLCRREVHQTSPSLSFHSLSVMWTALPATISLSVMWKTRWRSLRTLGRATSVPRRARSPSTRCASRTWASRWTRRTCTESPAPSSPRRLRWDPQTLRNC